MDFDEIFCNGGAWPKEQWIKLWWQSVSRSRFLDPDQGSDLRISNRFLINIFGDVWHGPKNSLLDFGGNSDHNPDPGIFLKDWLFTVVIFIDSLE